MKANHHTTTSIPVNDEYAALIGKAVYVFAYYEWTIICIMDYLRNGFVAEYSRPKRPMTSGVVKSIFNEIIVQSVFSMLSVTKSELDNCHLQFEDLIEKRNALIHAHPITDKGGSQILGYQTNQTKAITDIIWPNEKVKELIREIDKAAVEAGKILDKLRIKSR